MLGRGSLRARPLRRRCLLAAILGLAGIPLAACGELDPALGGLGIVAKPTPYRDIMVCDPAPPDTHFSAAQFGQDFRLIVTGRVVDALPGQWTTPDGTRPEDPWNVNYFESFIITPYVLELDRPPLVDHFGLNLGAGDRVLVATYGGLAGDDQVDHGSCEIDLDVEDHVILGLSTHRYAPSLTPNLKASSPLERRYQTPSGPAWNVASKLMIVDDGLVRPWGAQYFDEPQPLAEVIATIERAANESGP